jgi:hypothetical protein
MALAKLRKPAHRKGESGYRRNESGENDGRKWRAEITLAKYQRQKRQPENQLAAWAKNGEKS